MRNIDVPGDYCWLWGKYATTTGDSNSLPVFTPPPIPTSTLTPASESSFSVSYYEIENCGVWIIDFIIINTGELTFQSVTTNVTDNNTNENVVHIKDESEEFNFCILDAALNDLAPGESGYTTSDSLHYDPAGHSIDATIQVCSQKGLLGTCRVQTISFTP